VLTARLCADDHFWTCNRRITIVHLLPPAGMTNNHVTCDDHAAGDVIPRPGMVFVVLILTIALRNAPAQKNGLWRRCPSADTGLLSRGIEPAPRFTRSDPLNLLLPTLLTLQPQHSRHCVLHG
jgi:hypothetical protein